MQQASTIMSNSQGVLSTLSISQLSRSQLSVLQELENGETAVFLIGTCPQATDTFYRSIQMFESDRDFQNVMFAQLIADRWLSFFQVSSGSIVVLKALEQNDLDLARYDLAPGFSERSLQAFIKRHIPGCACVAALM